MSAENPITLPRKYAENKYAVNGVKKNFSGGNNISKTRITRFYHTGSGIVHGDRTLPKTLDTAQPAKAVAICSLASAGTAGQKVRLEFTYVTADSAAGESADPAAFQENIAISADVSAWTAKTKRRVEFTLTAANLAALDHLEYRLMRVPSHADDNVDQTLEVHDLFLLASY